LFILCTIFALLQGYISRASRPPLPEEGPLNAEFASSDPEAPETVEGRGEEEAKVSS
jgi:hypothetical protein